jgi:hypothetical protein
MGLDLKEILKDGGFKSRKLWLVVYAIHALLAGWFATAHWKALAPEFSTFVGGVIALVGLYFGSNVTTKATLATRVTGSAAPSDSPAAAPPQ